MPNYKVIVLQVSGLRNRVHNHKDIVSDKHFPPGRAEILVEGGFLEPLEEETGEITLTSITGIGAATGKKLNAEGINSIEDLAGADGDTLQEKFGEGVNEWIAKAKEMSQDGTGS